jgi:hypothetical protein
MKLPEIQVRDPFVLPVSSERRYYLWRCLHRLPGGELLMLWSSFSKGGYTISVARSAPGQLRGPWLQDSMK